MSRRVGGGWFFGRSPPANTVTSCPPSVRLATIEIDRRRKYVARTSALSTPNNGVASGSSGADPSARSSLGGVRLAAATEAAQPPAVAPEEEEEPTHQPRRTPEPNRSSGLRPRTRRPRRRSRRRRRSRCPRGVGENRARPPPRHRASYSPLRCSRPNSRRPGNCERHCVLPPFATGGSGSSCAM